MICDEIIEELKANAPWSSGYHEAKWITSTLDDYLHMLQEYSDSQREHIRKAIS